MPPGVSVGRALLPLRFMLGFIWIMGGLLNLQDVYFSCGLDCGGQKYGELIGIVWAEGVALQLPVSPTLYLSDGIVPNPIPGMGYLLVNFIAPNAALFMVTMATLELLIGTSILLGAFNRVSLLGAVMMNVLILLAAGHTHPGILRVNLLMAAGAASLFLAQASRYLGLDSILSRKLKGVPLLRRLCWS